MKSALERPEGDTRDIPLFRWYPALRELPRVSLCELPSPVQVLSGIGDGAPIWIKRDDLNALICGGNKVRALEFLLGSVAPGATVVTVGGAGSTHVLSTAIHCARLGAATAAVRWAHDMNPVAELVSARTEELLPASAVGRSAVLALTRARLGNLRGTKHYIPLGGSTPIGTLGHVNAALELHEQIQAGELPVPQKIVLPVGSGGTMAGMALGLAMVGLDVEVIGARVGPRLFVNRVRVLGLARRTARIIRRLTGKHVPAVDPANLRIVHDFYGGAYGRPLASADRAAAMLQDSYGIRLDATYSAKAFAAALDESRQARGSTLFWLTFDARCLTN